MYFKQKRTADYAGERKACEKKARKLERGNRLEYLTCLFPQRKRGLLAVYDMTQMQGEHSCQRQAPADPTEGARVGKGGGRGMEREVSKGIVHKQVAERDMGLKEKHDPQDQRGYGSQPRYTRSRPKPSGENELTSRTRKSSGHTYSCSVPRSVSDFRMLIVIASTHSPQCHGPWNSGRRFSVQNKAHKSCFMRNS